MKFQASGNGFLNVSAKNSVPRPHILIHEPLYLQPYSFEVYDYQSWYTWMDANWQISLYFSAVYLILLHIGKKWMENRAPFSLRLPLIAWNISLSVGSLFMYLRMYPELQQEIRDHGIYHSICNRDNHTIISSFWCLLFTLSKILEFGDTAFVVLRKQKLLFLHWYHHITVAIYTFYTFREFDPTGRYFGPMNSFIHFVMYAYYAARAASIKVPKKAAMVVTTLQVSQMFIGLGVNLVSLFGKLHFDDCHRPWTNICWALAMYFSYLILFLQFFVRSYLNSSSNIKTKNKKKVEKVE